MIKNAFDDERLHANVAHATGGGAPQIVNDPSRNLQFRIEPFLGLAPSAEPALPASKYGIAICRDATAFQDGAHGRAHRNNMQPAAFYALARQHNYSGVEV